MACRLVYSRTSRGLIRHLHPDLKATIRRRLKALAENPYAGKKLEKELAEYYSIRSGRYRMIYKINETDKVIEIHYVGHRKDVYQLFSKPSLRKSRYSASQSRENNRK